MSEDQFLFLSPSLQLPIPFSKPTGNQAMLFIADDPFEFENCSSHLALHSSEQEEEAMEKVETEDKSEQSDYFKPPHDLFEVLDRNTIPWTSSSCLTQEPQQQSSQSEEQLRISSILLEKSRKIETRRSMRRRSISYVEDSLSVKDPSYRPSYRRKSIAKRLNPTPSCVILSPNIPIRTVLITASLDLSQPPSTYRHVDMSLFNLTKIVFGIIKQQKSTSFKQVYETLLETVTPLCDRTLSASSLRRRVYDIVNVLASSGQVRRGHNKTLHLSRQEELAAQNRARLQTMRRMVQDKRDALKLRCKEILTMAKKSNSEDTEMISYCKALAKKMGSKARLRF